MGCSERETAHAAPTQGRQTSTDRNTEVVKIRAAALVCVLRCRYPAHVMSYDDPAGPLPPDPNPLWRAVDWLLGHAAPSAGPDVEYLGFGWSYDWCRFRRSNRCWYPIDVDWDGAQESGQLIVVPKERGYCPRVKWEAQQRCAVAEAGPRSPQPTDRRPRLVDASWPWSEGGQRGYPVVQWWSGPDGRKWMWVNDVGEIKDRRSFTRESEARAFARRHGISDQAIFRVHSMPLDAAKALAARGGHPYGAVKEAELLESKRRLTEATRLKDRGAGQRTSVDSGEDPDRRPSTMVEELERLAWLHAQRKLTDEEFNAAKRQTLGGNRNP